MLSSSCYLEIIYGPMFSGKTTKLIEIYNEKKSNNLNNCIALNYALDKRYTNEDKIVSHDGLFIKCISIIDIEDFLNENNKDDNKLKNINYIFINEAQFFPNLFKNVNFILKNLNINVILCGLDLDFKKNKFGEILDLIPYANKVYKLTGKCNNNNCLNPSIYSHRIIDIKEQLLIGNNVYMALCNECYNLKNS